MIMGTPSGLAILGHVRLLISIESTGNGRQQASAGRRRRKKGGKGGEGGGGRSIHLATHWLASPSPSILGTYGAGISLLYNLSQSTSANQPWLKMSAEPLRKFPYRFV